MHDGDREKANSIVANLTLPPKHIFDGNPYLNKVLQDEEVINLHAMDLNQLSQITQQIYDSYWNMYEDEIHSYEALAAEKKTAIMILEELKNSKRAD